MRYLAEFDLSNEVFVAFTDKVLIASFVICFIGNCYGFAIVYIYNTSNVVILNLLNKLYETQTKSEETKDVFIAAMS
jgi:hypothetical protein